MESKAVFITGVRRVAVESTEVEPVRSCQVLTHTLFSGISHGTEMAFYRGSAPHLASRYDRELQLFASEGGPTFSYPFRYGYCNVGRVVECGRHVRALKPGDIVFSGSPHQTVLTSDQDRWVRLPEGLDPRLGVFLANLRTTLNGVLDAGIHLGETVVVFGQGVLGQLLSQLARLSGAGKVIAVDMVGERLGMSLQLGADIAIDARQGDVARRVRELTGNRGADVVFEVTGAYSGLQEAIRTVAPRGTVVAMSFYQGAGTLTLGAEFHHNWVDIKCSQAGSVNPALSHRWNSQRLLEVASNLLPKLELGPLITHAFRFEEASRAYELIDKHPEDCIQVVLRYD